MVEVRRHKAAARAVLRKTVAAVSKPKSGSGNMQLEKEKFTMCRSRGLEPNQHGKHFVSALDRLLQSRTE